MRNIAFFIILSNSKKILSNNGSVDTKSKSRSSKSSPSNGPLTTNFNSTKSPIDANHTNTNISKLNSTSISAQYNQTSKNLTKVQEPKPQNNTKIQSNQKQNNINPSTNEKKKKTSNEEIKKEDCAEVEEPDSDACVMLRVREEIINELRKLKNSEKPSIFS
ncbi:hypothetical protein TVAGG3_0190790 [Trichomonas vaginalis G3]|uniref:hypothetical protein n=1 Tax=Trichomonas vaginalis (strain ATCC PRA-98 / G3) TaxID=412133 RepID=UPI0021E616D5|nr:hypothetical protein TVAGG3_0190790 [Trichomonas vaginalis G3]KAI5549953.1 hypothetical protein TVAGG3_0190790 [Trichomonas vaginalis G3]